MISLFEHILGNIIFCIEENAGNSTCHGNIRIDLIYLNKIHFIQLLCNEFALNLSISLQSKLDLGGWVQMIVINAALIYW